MGWEGHAREGRGRDILERGGEGEVGWEGHAREGRGSGVGGTC